MHSSLFTAHMQFHTSGKRLAARVVFTLEYKMCILINVILFAIYIYTVFQKSTPFNH